MSAEIETMPDMEARLGVSFESLYVAYDDEDDEVRVNLDVVAKSGSLQHAIEVVVSCYNASGQLIGSESRLVDDETFYKFESVTMRVECKIPARVRIYPKRF